MIADVSTQMFRSRVLEPLTLAAAWVVPIVLLVAAARESSRSIYRRSTNGIADRQGHRDARLMLAGATLGAVIAFVPIATWLWARFAMLVVLPALGATVGLAMSGLLPAVRTEDVRVAALEPRSVWEYVSARARRSLLTPAACIAVVTAVRLILPPEQPLPVEVGDFMFTPSRAAYVSACLIAVAVTGLSCLAVAALVRRSRPATDSDDLAQQDALRQGAVDRLLRWTTATLFLFAAALMTPLPARMGGVVLGEVQLVQRVIDILVVMLLAAAWAMVVLPVRWSRTARSG